MITAQQFVQAVNDAASKVHEYEWGASGENGKCDCIGLIMFALRKLGFKWPGSHGTNWTVRNAMTTLNYISSAKECFLGEVVFKAREPGEERYDLPKTYDDSPDRLDYYHVGVVTSLAPFTITHCTSVEGGIARDTSLGKWCWGGKLKYVNYESEAEKPMDILYTAIVTADSGSTVNMRKTPSNNGRILAKIPLGTPVQVLSEDGDWAHIACDGKDGYMMLKFLEKDGTDDRLEQAKGLIRQALDILEELQ